MELNKEDNGNRKFILCTNNESNICEEVTYPRLSNVIRGYNFNGKDEKVLFERKISYSVLKKFAEIDEEIERIKSEKEKDFNEFKIQIKNESIQLIGIKDIKGKKEGLGGNLKYFKTSFVDGERTDRNKKKLVDQSTEMLCLKEDCFNEISSGKSFKIFKNNSHYLGIIYDDIGIEQFKKEVLKIGAKISTYIFSLDDSVREEEFEEISDMVELKPIPQAILNVYWRIFR